MKKILSVLVLVVVFAITYTRPALAADTINGAKIFAANCAACHIGGRNVVMAAKTLQKAEFRGVWLRLPPYFPRQKP